MEIASEEWLSTNKNGVVPIPNYIELLEGCAAYIEQEKRDAMYKVACRLVSEAQWKPCELAEGIGVLLLTWNAAFYTRYGTFDFDKLEVFIENRAEELKKFNQRSILSYGKDDDVVVQQLFEELMEAVKSLRRGIKTPVGTAKALHMLAPDFFSIWDNKIASKYRVHWSQGGEGSPQFYSRFQNMTKQVADEVLKSYELAHKVSRVTAIEQLCTKWHPRIAIAIGSPKSPITRSLTKMIDEYNYSKYTMKALLGKYRSIVMKVLSSD
jgi:hypothetical protein